MHSLVRVVNRLKCALKIILKIKVYLQTGQDSFLLLMLFWVYLLFVFVVRFVMGSHILSGLWPLWPQTWAFLPSHPLRCCSYRCETLHTAGFSSTSFYNSNYCLPRSLTSVCANIYLGPKPWETVTLNQVWVLSFRVSWGFSFKSLWLVFVL